MGPGAKQSQKRKNKGNKLQVWQEVYAPKASLVVGET